MKLITLLAALLAAQPLYAQASAPVSTSQLIAKITALDQELAILREQLRLLTALADSPQTASPFAAAAAEAAKVKHEWALSTNIGSSSPALTSPTSDAATTTKPTTAGTDEAYWRGRLQPLQLKLDTDVRTREPLAARRAQLLAALDPNLASFTLFGAELSRVTTEVQRLNALIVDDQRAIDGLKEEGRAAGALPGWFR